MNVQNQNNKSYTLDNSHVFRGLCWYEWHRQKSIHAILAVIFFSVFFTRAIYESELLYLVGLFFGIVCGLNAGINGMSEEYFLSLPPQRKLHYFSRLVVGLISLILLLSLWAGVSKTLVPFFFHSLFGIQEYSCYANNKMNLSIFLFDLALASIFFSINFSVQINLRWEQRGIVPVMVGLELSYIVLALYDIAKPLLPALNVLLILSYIVFCGLILWVGYVVYRNKEITFSPRPSQLGLSSAIFLMSVLLIGIHHWVKLQITTPSAIIGFLIVVFITGAILLLILIRYFSRMPQNRDIPIFVPSPKNR